MGKFKFIDHWLEKWSSRSLPSPSRRILEWQAPQAESIREAFVQFRPSGVRVKSANVFPALVAIGQTPVLSTLGGKLTERECARLQGFPDSFRLHHGKSKAYKRFGNSVNVEVTKRVFFGHC